MDTLLLAAQVLTWLGLTVATLFLKNHFSSYLSKKGENLATKEDIAVITQQVEGARAPFAAAIEAFKHDLQERSRSFTERQKLYVEFAQASADVFLSGRSSSYESISRYHSMYAAIVLAAPDHVTRTANKLLDVTLVAFSLGRVEELQPAFRQAYAEMILEMRRDGFDPQTSLTVGDYRFVTIIPGKSSSQD